MNIRQRLFQILIALDQLANTLIWIDDDSWADETLSARCYRKKWWALEAIINLLFWDRNHCMDSFMSEQQRKHLPEEYRT
jgi:hypothetical protein